MAPSEYCAWAPDAATAKTDTPAVTGAPEAQPNLKPIETNLKALDLTKTADTSVQQNAPSTETKALPVETAAAKENAPAATGSAEVSLPGFLKEMKAGEKAIVPVMVKSSGTFRSAVLGLKFDAAKVAVRTVTFGDVFGETMANTAASPFINQSGKMFVSLGMKEGVAPGTFGILAYVEIEALADGKPVLTVEKDVMNFLSGDGKNFAIRY